MSNKVTFRCDDETLAQLEELKEREGPRVSDRATMIRVLIKEAHDKMKKDRGEWDKSFKAR
jgi:hypothetical protein